MRIYLLLTLLFPFLGAFVLAVAGRHFPRRFVEFLACASIILSFLTSLLAFFSSSSSAQTVILFPWIDAEGFSAPMSVLYDPLAGIMALMVTFVSSLIHLYSVGFMREDEDYVRFFCYLNLFVFAMLVVTLADNVLFLYLGWEGVGFCSYALIGFWYSDGVKAAAGRKAFILTRIGDVSLGVAIAIFFLLFQDFSIAAIHLRAPSLEPHLATALGLLLLWAAVGKSAQLPLAVWLPDAMAGPTPVSALIHAATMVTAGAYLLMRFFPILTLSPFALEVTAAVGGISSFFAACAALAQKDIKRVLAYSTISQVGYMFLGVGAGDVTGSMFLLLAHAFFKALLFLTAGCIIQALHEEHDIFRMGSLYRSLPALFAPFLAGALSLGAIPPFGGFFGKDHILMATFSHPEWVYKLLWGVAELTAFLTTLYTFRLFFLVFSERPPQATGNGGMPRGLRPLHGFMIWTLWPLAILSLVAGSLNFPELFSGGAWLAHHLAPLPGGVPFLRPTPAGEWAIMIISGLISILGLVVSYFFYRSPYPAGAASPLRKWLEQLFFSGFYLDQFYSLALADPYRRMSGFLRARVDEEIVDAGLEKMSKTLPALSRYFQLWTTGKLSTYLTMLFLGFTAILGAIALGWYSR